MPIDSIEKYSIGNAPIGISIAFYQLGIYHANNPIEKNIQLELKYWHANCLLYHKANSMPIEFSQLNWRNPADPRIQAVLRVLRPQPPIFSAISISIHSRTTQQCVIIQESMPIRRKSMRGEANRGQFEGYNAKILIYS